VQDRLYLPIPLTSGLIKGMALLQQGPYKRRITVLHRDILATKTMRVIYNPAILLYLSQARQWISNVICCDLFLFSMR
jgi:hypothetical protein